jgi:hypothetical protein
MVGITVPHSRQTPLSTMTSQKMVSKPLYQRFGAEIPPETPKIVLSKNTADQIQFLLDYLRRPLPEILKQSVALLTAAHQLRSVGHHVKLTMIKKTGSYYPTISLRRIGERRNPWVRFMQWWKGKPSKPVEIPKESIPELLATAKQLNTPVNALISDAIHLLYSGIQDKIGDPSHELALVVTIPTRK